MARDLPQDKDEDVHYAFYKAMVVVYMAMFPSPQERIKAQEFIHEELKKMMSDEDDQKLDDRLTKEVNQRYPGAESDIDRLGNGD